MKENTCVCCGEVIPEGIQTCPYHMTEKNRYQTLEEKISLLYLTEIFEVYKKHKEVKKFI